MRGAVSMDSRAAACIRGQSRSAFIGIHRRFRPSAPRDPVSYRIGIDVGGTFTDFVLVRPNGSICLSKSPTTPRDQSEGVINGIEQLARGEHLSLGELLGDTAVIVHGTTTADNTLIEMSGAVTGLIT